MYRTKGYDHVNIHVWFVVSRLGFSVLAPPAWSPDASFPDPDVCAVRPTGGRVLDVPLAAEQGPRRPRRPEGRECPRGDAPLFTTLRRSAAGSAASVHQQNMRKIPRPLIFGRAERESPAPYLCVCSKMDGFAPLHGVTYCTGTYRVPVGVFLPVRLCGRGRRHTRRRAGSPARNHIVMHLTGMALDIVQESPWQNAWRPPDCQCFALCETGELMKLFSHLPLLVYNDSSPWFGYLTRVYRTAVPLPFNLRNLIMFYPGLLPTNTHRCETNPWSKHGNASQLPQCADQNCRAGYVKRVRRTPICGTGRDGQLGPPTSGRPSPTSSMKRNTGRPQMRWSVPVQNARD